MLHPAPHFSLSLGSRHIHRAQALPAGGGKSLLLAGRGALLSPNAWVQPCPAHTMACRARASALLTCCCSQIEWLVSKQPHLNPQSNYRNKIGSQTGATFKVAPYLIILSRLFFLLSPFILLLGPACNNTGGSFALPPFCPSSLFAWASFLPCEMTSG